MRRLGNQDCRASKILELRIDWSICGQGRNNGVKPMQDVRPLPRHPDPRPTEGLWGYILRVSRSNGFRSPWGVIARAGMEQHEARGASINVAKLAVVTRKDRTRLQSIGYSNATEKRSYALLGHTVPRTALELDSPHICPECVGAMGFIETHWDLAIMTACPVHFCRAVWRCNACGSLLRWYRPDLLHCQCGAQIQPMLGTSIRAEEGNLLQVIRAKVFHLLPLVDGSSGLPVSDLYQLELRDLLRLVNILQRCQRMLSRDPEHVSDTAMAVTAAVEYLREWPTKFFEMLEGLRAFHLDQRRSIRELYSPIYSSFLKKRKKEKPGQFDFMRRAFLEFVSNHVEGKVIDIRVMRSFGLNVERRFVTRAELSRRLDIDPRSVVRSIPSDAITSESRKKCLAIDMRRCNPLPSPTGVIMRIREAAREIGLPVEVLRALKASREFETHHQLVSMPGFRDMDIRRFQARFANLPSIDPASEHDAGSISVRRALGQSCQGVEQRVAFIRALLQCEIRILGQTTESVGDLIILASDLETFLDNVQPGRRDVMTCQEAAVMLNCEPSAITCLIANSYLDGQKSRRGWRVTRDSVAVFDRDFVRISEIAKALGTSSRKLVGICAQQGIELCRVHTSASGTRAFVRRSSVR